MEWDPAFLPSAIFLSFFCHFSAITNRQLKLQVNGLGVRATVFHWKGSTETVLVIVLALQCLFPGAVFFHFLLQNIEMIIFPTATTQRGREKSCGK